MTNMFTEQIADTNDIATIPTTDGAERPIDVLVCHPWLDRATGLMTPSGKGKPLALSGFVQLVATIEEGITTSKVSTAGREEHADVAERTARAKGETRLEAIALARQIGLIDAVKGGLPLLVPGVFRENRKLKKNCERITAYIGDFDRETAETWLAAVTALNASGVGWLAYGSPKDGLPKTIDDPARHVKRRLVIPTSRDMSPDESECMQRALPARLGLTLDPQSLDPSRGFYLGAVDDRTPVFEGTEGRALNVDELLATVPAEQPKTKSAKSKDPKTKSESEWKDVSSAPRESRRCPAGVSREDHALTIARTAPAAVQGKGGHTALFSTACDLVVGLGLAPDVARDLLWREYNPRCAPPWTEDERAAFDRKVDEAQNSSIRDPGYLLATAEWAHPVPSIETPLVFARDKRGDVAKTIDNALVYFRHVLRGRVRFEENAGRIVCSGLGDSLGETLTDGEWTDVHTTRLRAICERAGLALSKDAVDSAIEAYAQEHAYNVLTKFLVECSQKWDQKPRVDNFFAAYFGADDTPAARAVSRVFMLSLARRGLEPGAKVDTCPVLVGSQGIRKSSGLAALVGAAWFSDSPLPIGDKDAMQNLRGTWLWEFSENESLSRRERNQVKAFLSSATDKFRASYGRHSIVVPRQTCFAASTNDVETLTDPTGNRRFLPVRVAGVDVAAIERDRVQLLGEAACRIGAHENWWPTADEDRVLDVVRGEHEEVDPWEESIAAWLEKRGLEPFMLDDVFDDISGAVRIPPAQRDKKAQGRASAILRRLKYEKFRDKRRGARRDRRLWRGPLGADWGLTMADGVGPVVAAEKTPEEKTGAQGPVKSPNEHPAPIAPRRIGVHGARGATRQMVGPVGPVGPKRGTGSVGPFRRGAP